AADGVTVRNDTGVFEGGEISIYYDPMIAKLITHAPTREAAISAQARSLDAFYIDGIRHNIPFLAALMQHPRWQAGRLSTGFIAEEFPDGFSSRAPAGPTAQAIAAVAAAVDHVLGERKRRISGQMAGRPVVRERLRSVWLDRAEIRLEVLRQGGGIGVRLLDETEQGPGSGPVILLSSSWKPGEPGWHRPTHCAPVALPVPPPP